MGRLASTFRHYATIELRKAQTDGEPPRQAPTKAVSCPYICYQIYVESNNANERVGFMEYGIYHETVNITKMVTLYFLHQGRDGQCQG